MTSFSKEIKSPYGTESFNDIKDNYNWIINALNKMSNSTPQIQSEFLFYIGDIYCSTDSFSEFTENAYGASDFKIISFTIRAEFSDERITIHYLTNLAVKANKRESLEQIVSILESTSADEKKETTTITYNDSVIVQGDNNILASNSVVSVNQEKPQSTIRKWLSSIGQNIVANGIWYLLCLVGGAIITMLINQ